MKKLVLIILILLSAQNTFANPFNNHDDLLHDLGHVGAACLIVETQDFILRLDPQTKKEPLKCFLIEVSIALAINQFYESVEEHTPEVSLERDISALAGAAIVSYSIHF